MPKEIKAVVWDAYAHYHFERSSDWFWILGIITVAVGLASILLGNVLFGIVVFLCGGIVGIHANREPGLVEYSVTQRGIRIDEKLYPYTTLESYCIDEEHPFGPHLLVKSEKIFMPLLVLPIPDDAIDEVEEVIGQRIPEAHLEEPLGHKLLEFFGF